MLKHLFTLLAVFLVFSCHPKHKNMDSDMDNGQTQVYDAEEYQVIDEDNAATLNAAEEQKIEEVEVSDRVFFAYDSFFLDAEAKKVLDTQAAWLNSDITLNVVIEGHADERGTREYNLALGERRAKAVKDYLVSKGVDASRIKTVSYGKERPAFFGATEEIFAKNRRAVTVVK